MNPKYSIAIPAYNRREYLRQAIQSVLEQTVSDWEVVVSDDCSTQDLAAVVEAFNDSRVSYHRSPDHLGATKNSQRAVNLSKGQYVITLNSDDLLLPKCLERVGACLDQNPGFGAVYCSVTYLKDGRVSGCQHVPNIQHADAEVLAAQPWLEKYVGTTPSCCAFRKEAFERISGYRTFLRFAYDWDFYMRMLRLGGGVIFLPEIIGIYRQHEEQMVLNHSMDGLRDILDLWCLPEYQHWPASFLTDNVINEVRILQLQGQSAGMVLREVLNRKLFLKLAWGLPGPVWNRLSRRFRQARTSIDENYTVPTNLDEAIATANRLLGSRTSDVGSAIQ
ncbi:MAG: glycosyltransferase [Verrucomicrobia bacterium]|nr:glycosyltransferase [Verrucomicrobiota bacterium]